MNLTLTSMEEAKVRVRMKREGFDPDTHRAVERYLLWKTGIIDECPPKMKWPGFPLGFGVIL